MTAMNVVHMRVKPGKEEEYVRLHQEMDMRSMPRGHNFWLIRSGERSFIVVGEWDSPQALADARPAMVANLDKLRPLAGRPGRGPGAHRTVVGRGGPALECLRSFSALTPVHQAPTATK